MIRCESVVRKLIKFIQGYIKPLLSCLPGFVERELGMGIRCGYVDVRGLGSGWAGGSMCVDVPGGGGGSTHRNTNHSLEESNYNPY